MRKRGDREDRNGFRSQGEKEKEEIENRERVSGTKDCGKRRRERRQKECQEPRRAGKGLDREQRKGFRNQGERKKEAIQRTVRVSRTKENWKRRRYRRQKVFQELRRAGKGRDREDKKISGTKENGKRKR